MAKIEIPDDLYEKLKESAEERGFPSVEDYIVYVLGDAVSEEEEEMSEEDQKKIKERLKALGYI